MGKPLRLVQEGGGVEESLGGIRGQEARGLTTLKGVVLDAPGGAQGVQKNPERTAQQVAPNQDSGCK